jgi:hypothetical protein
MSSPDAQTADAQLEHGGMQKAPMLLYVTDDDDKISSPLNAAAQGAPTGKAANPPAGVALKDAEQRSTPESYWMHRKHAIKT